MKLHLMTFLFLLSVGCKKKIAPENPLNQLPPETQTGAQTFGCLINGEPFVPGGAGMAGGSLAATYQQL